MKVNDLDVVSHKAKKRVGRGISAGQGKTAGRGTKGQNSRTGSKLRLTFMGGQGSLMQRIPKHRGFKSLRVPAQVVYTDQLNVFDGKTASNSTLAEAGIIATEFHAVKVILRGEVTAKVTVDVQGVSKGAQAVIEKAGGSIVKSAVPLLKSTKAEKAE